MTAHTFYLVDVFAEEKYTGNQLAVFRNAGGLPDDQMQKIAREMNFSETTFILSDAERSGGYDVRIFTPAREVPFAGHPTLGTAWVIREAILKTAVKRVNLNLGVGQIPVTFESNTDGPDLLWMRQKAPQFGPMIETAQIAEVLGLDNKDLDDRFGVQEVSTGLWFIVVPLLSLDAVKRARIIKDAYGSLIKDRNGKAILVFCPETYGPENDLNVRVFVPYYGIDEDPATGSGNGALAAYLAKHRYSDTRRIDLRVEQGYEIDRPSLLRIKAQEQEEQIQVEVGGRVIPVARGQWL